MKPKTYKCRICGESYIKARPLQVVCNDIKCAMAHVEKKKATVAAQLAKQQRKEIREQRKKLKRLSDWLREAQAAVNTYRRELFEDEPCISCGRYHNGQYHAGHYLSRGAHPELRFEENNIWKQCQPCNVHLSGNQIAFRLALVKRIGVKMVEWLEGPHVAKKYTIQDAENIKTEYKNKLKELRERRSPR